MITFIIGIVLASHAYHSGLRLRAGETPSPIFEGKHGRLFAAFTLLLGFGIAALALKPEWNWPFYFAVAVATLFWVMSTRAQRSSANVQQLSAADRDRAFFGLALLFWFAGIFVFFSVIAAVGTVFNPTHEVRVGLLGLAALLYFFSLPALMNFVSRRLRKREEAMGK